MKGVVAVAGVSETLEYVSTACQGEFCLIWKHAYIISSCPPLHHQHLPLHLFSFFQSHSILFRPARPPMPTPLHVYMYIALYFRLQV